MLFFKSDLMFWVLFSPILEIELRFSFMLDCVALTFQHWYTFSNANDFVLFSFVSEPILIEASGILFLFVIFQSCAQTVLLHLPLTYPLASITRALSLSLSPSPPLLLSPSFPPSAPRRVCVCVVSVAATAGIQHTWQLSYVPYLDLALAIERLRIQLLWNSL